uniref:G-protein coupled receptors family 1 profile domain-containing protein n=1 Tax=Romanomermis culicivorax TaxID=13658 RepID=A0A915K4V1_ROMCU
MTVLMTLERYLCVAWPTSSKSVFSHPNVKKATYAVVVIFLVIHAQTPISRMTEMSVCEATGRRIYKLLMRPGYLYSFTEKIYSLLNLLLSLVLPGILLVAFTSRLTFILCCRSLPQFSARKRCVTRIALATMMSQLTLEVPAVGVYGAAALRGVEFVNEDPTMCTCHILSNFANQMNASICFLIYLSCSETFRHLCYSRFCLSAAVPLDQLTEKMWKILMESFIELTYQLHFHGGKRQNGGAEMS